MLLRIHNNIDSSIHSGKHRHLRRVRLQPAGRRGLHQPVWLAHQGAGHGGRQKVKNQKYHRRVPSGNAAFFRIIFQKCIDIFKNVCYHLKLHQCRTGAPFSLWSYGCLLKNDKAGGVGEICAFFGFWAANEGVIALWCTRSKWGSCESV